MVSLARRYGDAHLEHACALAVSAGVWRLRFLRACLSQHEPTALTTRDKIIQAVDTYAKHFAIRTTQGELPFDE
jgi:hypothetical protein